MSPTDFHVFCKAHKIYSDTYYGCTFSDIQSNSEFALTRPFLLNGQAYLASATCMHVNGRDVYTVHERIYAKRCRDVMRDQARIFEAFLETRENVSYYSARHSAPSYVDEPGYWDDAEEELVVSQHELEHGDFNYYYVDSEDYSHHDFRVILVLNDVEEKAA